MEYIVVESDLHSKEIKPGDLIDNYINKLKYDINSLFDKSKFRLPGCPTDGDFEINESFMKLGMQYFVSSKYNNIYISPRPDTEQLLKFYQNSSARKYWLQELWKLTSENRKKKLIKPHLEWIKTIASQYLSDNNLSIAEYYPNQWGYRECVKEVLPDADYFLVCPLFNPDWSESKDISNAVIPDDDSSADYDVICLFEALNRSENPADTLRWVWKHLKPGGLCFIYVVLSSGFEIQVIGEHSNSIIPPEGMNFFSYEGLKKIIEDCGEFKTIEFSTPGLLDVENVTRENRNENVIFPKFIKYMVNRRSDQDSIKRFQEFLQINKLSSIGRLALQKS